MNYYSHNIGDYAQATMHLTLVEDAVYSRLLRRYYAEEQPIAADLVMVCRWVGARTSEEKDAVQVVLGEFFELEDGVYRNKRADLEIQAYHAKAETNRLNGKKGGRPSQKPKETQSVISGLANGTQQEPSRNPNQEPRTRAPPSPQGGRRLAGSGCRCRTGQPDVRRVLGQVPEQDLQGEGPGEVGQAQS